MRLRRSNYKMATLGKLGVTLLMTLFINSCTEQHNPAPFLAQIRSEQAFAQAPASKLTKDGKIPVKEGASSAAGDPISEKYATLCAACHGATGKGDGAAGQGLTPKARDFTDSAWQAATNDDRITKVIKEGGASVGLSASMVAWGAMVSDAEVAGLVKMIRGFK